MRKDLPLSFEDSLRKQCPALFKLQEALSSDEELWYDPRNGKTNDLRRQNMIHANPNGGLSDYMQKRNLSSPASFDSSDTPSPSPGPAAPAGGLSNYMQNMKNPDMRTFMLKKISTKLPSLDYKEIFKIYQMLHS
jgi:hypothetical protein